MKTQLRRRLWVKVAALFLTVLTLLGSLLTVGCSAVSMVFAGAAGTTEAAQEQIAEEVLYRYALSMASDIVWAFPLDEYEDLPFTYTAVDDSGQILLNTYEGTPYLAESTATYMYHYYPYPDSDTSVLRQVSVEDDCPRLRCRFGIAAIQSVDGGQQLIRGAES